MDMRAKVMEEHLKKLDREVEGLSEVFKILSKEENKKRSR